MLYAIQNGNVSWGKLLDFLRVKLRVVIRLREFVVN